MRNLLFIISGPSGVGKGTLVKRLLKLDGRLIESVSCTTRKPRPGEVDGREYFFITREDFLARMQRGEFLEADEHFGNYYGTPFPFVKEQLKEKSVILEIDVVGGANCKKLFPEKTILILIAPPSQKELEARLVGRDKTTVEAAADRLSRAEYELGQRDRYDYVVVNDNLERATEELLSIIEKEINKD